MRKIIVKIDRDKAVELERANFELNFTKDIIQRVIEAHPLQIYNRLGVELQRKYSLLAAAMEKEYVPEYLKGHKYTWNVPNGSDEMIIDVLCGCEIEGLE